MRPVTSEWLTLFHVEWNHFSSSLRAACISWVIKLWECRKSQLNYLTRCTRIDSRCRRISNLTRLARSRTSCRLIASQCPWSTRQSRVSSITLTKDQLRWNLPWWSVSSSQITSNPFWKASSCNLNARTLRNLQPLIQTDSRKKRNQFSWTLSVLL